MLQAQTIFLGRGFLRVISLQLAPPTLRRGAAAGEAAAGMFARNAARGVLARAGTVTLEASLARNLVKPTGKLVEILRAIQPRFLASTPRSLPQAFDIVAEAAISSGKEPGIVIEGTLFSERLVIQNAGDFTTTILRTGEIIVRRGEVIILRLIP